jgi:chromosome segregation ATPase
MAALRVEADDSAALAEELKGKNKTLEQENLAKEQEITSLSHKNQLLEAQVEKLETDIKEHKTKAEEGAGHLGTNESLTRKLQVLEEEAETADRNLREVNEKYVLCTCDSHRRSNLPERRVLIQRSFQAPPNRRQSRPLRAQGPGPRAVQCPVGDQIRRDGQEVQRDEEGIG